MNEKQLQRWEEMRAKGKKRFIIENGVFGWGIPSAVMFTFLMTFMEHRTIIFDKDFLTMFSTSIVLFPIGGVFWGMWVWSSGEKRYNKVMDEKQTTL